MLFIYFRERETMRESTSRGGEGETGSLLRILGSGHKPKADA